MIALLCAMVALPLATASASIPSAKTAVKLPAGVGTPTPGSGMYTQAALDNPRCSVDKDRYPFGRFDGAVVGGGGVCVRPFKAGENNGGATSPGVTKDKITIVAVFNKDPVTSSPPKKLVTGANGTMWDAYHDLLVASAQLYETWGRQLDIKYYYSTGNDEAAQRADAVAIKAMKPFAVVNTYNVGLGVMATDLAKAKILVYDAETSKSDFEALAPYLWGSTDPEVAVTNAAEVLGKQLVGKKAEYGGDDVKSQTRKFGLVSRDNEIDVAGFKQAFAKYKGTVSSEASYPPTGGTYGDATTAGQAAPTIVSKMKADGVTTVVLFSDAAMNKAMMDQASSQNWFPEWFHTGNSYADYYAFAQSMPADQRAHFFGISGSSPYFTPATDPETAAKGPAGSVEDWYWGLNNYTSPSSVGNNVTWLLQGIHGAGPDLTPKTFQQGEFATPATGGSASGVPVGAMVGLGRTTGLPYDEYNRAPADYLLMWMSNTEGIAATGQKATPTAYFVKDPTSGEVVRYRAGAWPTKKVAWFDSSKSVDHFDTAPATWSINPANLTRTTCQGCPSTGATSPTPNTPSPDGFVLPVPTTSAS